RSLRPSLLLSSLPPSSTSYCLSSLPFSSFSHHPAPTETYTLSLHDALPIYGRRRLPAARRSRRPGAPAPTGTRHRRHRPRRRARSGGGHGPPRGISGDDDHRPLSVRALVDLIPCERVSTPVVEALSHCLRELA